MTKLSIKPVRKAARGHNRYCGPAALSIITGVDTAEAASIIRFVSRRPSIKGTSSYEILKALSLLGYQGRSALKVDPRNKQANPTLAAWLKSETRDSSKLYLVAAGHHWQVVQGRRFCCGKTGEVVSIRHEGVKRRARVTGVWSVERVATVSLASVVPIRETARKTEEARRASSARAKAKKLAALHDIDVEVEQFGGADRYTQIIVWGPRGVDWGDDEAGDPFCGDHYADNWEDALSRIETYVEVLKAREVA